MVQIGDADNLDRLARAGKQGELRQQLLGPLQRHLPGQGPVIVAVDGELGRVPFAALLGREVRVLRSGRELIGLPAGTPEEKRGWWRRLLGW